MKKIINKILNKFSLEVHGVGYMRKLKKSVSIKDAFNTQFRYFENDLITIFDVGANRGDITLKYRNLFPNARIHAFEPFDMFFEDFLQKNSTDPNVIFNPIALAEINTQSTLYINKSYDTNSLLKSQKIGASSDESCKTIASTQIVAKNISTYCIEKGIKEIDILKLDTQGSELNILKGAQNLLKEQKIKLIYSECYFQKQYEDQPLFSDISSFLEVYGYYLEDIYDPYFNDQHLLWCDVIFTPVKK